MRKIITSFFVIIMILGTASAQNYPQKLINGDFTTLQKFRGIYTNVYDNQDNLTEACKRTLQWPEFWQKTIDGNDISLYSVLNCENLNNKGNLSGFLNLKERSIQGFQNLENDFIKRFGLELNLLEMENDLRRETGLAYIFADGRNQSHNSAEGTTSDSPFDLVSDLNEIDEIFFGEKSEKPVLKFAEKNKLEVNDDFPTNNDNKDYWLTQKKDNLPDFKEEFDNYENNLSGGLWRSGIKVLREKLNTNALWLRYVGKTALDAVATDGTFVNPGFDANIHNKPNLTKDSPEAIELRWNPLPELNAYINNYILAESSYKTDSHDGTLNKTQQVSKVLAIKDAQSQIIREKLARFERKNSRNTENYSAHRNILNIQMFNEYIDLFREKLRFLRKAVFPYFLSKPQHSS